MFTIQLSNLESSTNSQLHLGSLACLHPFRGKLCSVPEEVKQKQWNDGILPPLRLILLTVFLLLLCGITASCIKCCCRRKRPPVESFSRHPHDLTATDSESTAHSTVTCEYLGVNYSTGICYWTCAWNSVFSSCNDRDFLMSSQNNF